MSGNAGTLLGPCVVGDFVAYTVPVAKSGTYQVKVGVKTLSNRGIFKLSIGGANQGPLQDEYSPTITYGARDLGTVTFASAGSYTFKFSVTGRNPSSTGDWLAFDYIELTP